MLSRTLKVLLCVSFASSGPAFAQDDAHDAATEADGAAAKPNAVDLDHCVDVTRSLDMSVVSDEHVYIRTYGGNHYILTTGQVCRNLKRSYLTGQARLQPYGRRICTNDGSYLIYTWFDKESVCPILTVERVDGRDEAMAIAHGDRPPVEAEEVPLE